MTRSMTGFGQAQREIAGALYAVEIRSLNSRHFKAVVRVPELWSALGGDIERRLHERLHRGTIHLAALTKTPSADAAYQVNAPVLERYIEQLESIRPEQSELELRLELGSLLALPGVCTPAALDERLERVRPEWMAMIDEAIDAVLAMRTEEGKTIAADLLASCSTIHKQLVAIARRAPKVVQDYHQRLKRRVEDMIGSAELALNGQDLAREVAVFAERSDIAEELSRLSSHLAQFQAAMKDEEQPGRKLDFIAQELLREANTIASKANDTDIARAIVEIKTAVDRIKEQVQNVE